MAGAAILAIPIAIWLINGNPSPKQNVRQVETEIRTNSLSVASLDAPSLETMISNLPTVFNCARSRPVRFSDEICWRIHNLTNHSEQVLLVQRYSEMLLSLPLDEGGYRKREAAMDNIWKMAVHWSDVMYRLHVSSEFHVNFWLSMLRHYRKALECGLSAPPADVECSHSDDAEDKLPENSFRMFESIRFPTWPPVGRIRLGGPSRDPLQIRKGFVIYATKVFLGNARRCRDVIIPAILNGVPSEERELLERKARNAFMKINEEFDANILNSPFKGIDK